MKKWIIFPLLSVLFFASDTHSSHPGVDDLAITEIMYNPSAASDDDGEWFEIYNTSSSRTFALGGCVISDAATTRPFTFPAGFTIDPKEAIVVARYWDPEYYGDFVPDWQYSQSVGIADLTLNNSGDTITISYSNTIIDSVTYDGSLFASGHSMELDSAHVDAISNDDMANWMESTNIFGAGDYGTPGVVNEVFPEPPPLEAVIYPAVEIGWLSDSGTIYQIQYSTNMVSSNWFDLGIGVMGNGLTNYTFDSTRESGERFYRIITIP